MSFEEVAQLTAQKAETLAYSSETASEIYGLIRESRSFSPQINTVTQLLKQLEYACKREINQRLHATTLIHYHRNKRIPRGLRIALKPMLCRNNKSFVEKWYQILNKCSLDLILLIIEELSTILKDLEEEISVIKSELEKNDNLNESLEDINAKLEKYEKETHERKVRIFRSDTIDYKLEEVYTWAEVYNQKRWQQQKSTASSFQESVVSDADISKSRTPLISVAGTSTQQIVVQPTEKPQKATFLSASPAANNAAQSGK